MAKPYVPVNSPLEHVAERILDDSEDNDLDGEELRSLNEALDESAAQFARGEGIPAELVLQEMRQILYETR